MRELVIGGDSLIGATLVRRLSEAGRHPLVTSRRARCGALHLDLANGHDWQPPEGISVAYLVAAITSLRACESDPVGSRTVNVDNTVAVAQALLKRGARLVFLSTNLVFDGETPHVPADADPAPRTEYGRQKAEAERRLLGEGSRVSLLRLSKVLSANLPLLSSWIERIRNGDTITAFSDLSMSPVELDQVADLIMRLGESDRGGVYQYSARSEITYEAAARHLATLLGRPDAVRTTTSTAAGVRVAARSRHSTLDCGRTAAEYGFDAPEPLEAVEIIARQLTEAPGATP